MVSPAPPTADISVEKCADPEKLHSEIKAACRRLLEGWAGLADAQIEVRGGAGAGAAAARQGGPGAWYVAGI